MLANAGSAAAKFVAYLATSVGNPKRTHSLTSRTPETSVTPPLTHPDPARPA